MKQLVIDRFEGKYAICEDSDQKYFAIELSELPKEAKPGCVLQITDEGELRLDEEETQRRRQRILDKQRRAFGG
ncbi:MAG TPA: DUF3006 domain-containing protein [Candidatus Acutalibacter stercorigallinarum]|nr:DUF3006 domain-containing protein [Candidatus Acutalibacter stercorigallinarum]